MRRIIAGKPDFFKHCILNVGFQNDFVNRGTYASTMGVTHGHATIDNSPTFAPSGRKAGEYSAVFNGAQALRTTNIQFPINNTDKASISFWVKKYTQTETVLLYELGPISNGNLFAGLFYSTNNNIRARSRNAGLNEREVDLTNNTWRHVCVVIDRSLDGVNEIKIYLEGILVSSTLANNTDNNGNFGLYAGLFIGARAGTSLFFKGELMKFKVFDIGLTAEQCAKVYQLDL